MEKLLHLLNKNKIAVAIIIVAILILGVLGKTLIPNNQTSNPAQNKNFSSLHDSLALIESKIPTEAGKTNFIKQSNNLTQSVDPELVDLDSQIITCSATVDSLLSSSPSYGGSCVAGGGTLPSTKGLYLGGQCCGTLMDTKGYHERFQKLQAYKNMPNIPLDPMHTPIVMAKQWIDYDNSTTLTPDEQKIFDEAYAISKEKPCCCKCWHYFVDEGIAKKMIVDGQFNSKQIADFWDDSEICGV